MDPVIERFLAENGTAPVPFSTFMEFALYDETIGFYSGSGRDRTGRAGGRGGDFLTSPEVGPLFGALVAERLDREWDRLGNPTPFVVVECGAGPGTLARSIALATPRCASALRHLMVEISPGQRALHAEHLAGYAGVLDRPGVEDFVTNVNSTSLGSDGSGPRFASCAAMPDSISGVVLANELLDNLPFDIVRRGGDPTGELTDDLVVEQLAVAVVDDSYDFVVEPIECTSEERAVLATATPGEWLPLQRRARLWVRDAIARIDHGLLVVIDYGATTAELAARPHMGWLRTFVGNERGGHPLDAPGSHDITADVAIDQVILDHEPTRRTTQRNWLADLGIDALVEEGRRVWNERAAAPDVVALRARSRVGEAEALTGSDGLGDFAVLEWRIER